MSHVVSIKTELTDLEAIKAVCAELGLELRLNQKTYNWWGSHVGDYPLPEGFTAEDLGHCEHAIGVPGTTWEIGLAKKPGMKGYRMLFDFFGSQGQPILEALGGQQANRFLQTYKTVRVEREAKKLGYQTQRQLGKNGAVNVLVSNRGW